MSSSIILKRSAGPCVLMASNTRWTPDGLKAHIYAGSSTPGKEYTIHDGELCVSSLRDKEALARYLDKAEAGKNWFVEIADFFSEVIDTQRKASQPVVLSEVPRPETEPLIEVGGIPILANHHNIFFGDGETYKSLTSLWIAGLLAQQGKNVMVCDWEMDAPDHRVRLESLFGQDMPKIHYEKPSGPILEVAQGLKVKCEERQIDFLVVDSVGFAIGMPPESAEAALAYFRALNEVGVRGTINIAHSTKTIKKAEVGKEKPFGSNFWHASARLTWYFKPILTRDNQASVSIGCRKSNLVKRPDPRVIDLTFTDDRIKMDVRPEKTDAFKKPEPKPKDEAETPGVKEQIQMVLLAGPITKDDLRNKLVGPNMTKDAFRVTFNRYFTTNEEGKVVRIQ